MTACLGLKPTSFGRVRRALALREAARTRRSAGLSSASPISRQGPPGPQNITGGIHLPVMAAAADGPGPRPGGKRPRRWTRVGGGVRQAPGQGVGLHLAPQLHGFDGDHFVAAHETPDPFVHRALAAGGGFLRKHCHRPAARRLPVTAWGLGGQGDDRGLRDRVGALPRHPSEVREGTRGVADLKPERTPGVPGGRPVDRLLACRVAEVSHRGAGRRPAGRSALASQEPGTYCSATHNRPRFSGG